MISSPTNKNYKIIPQGEIRCLWMTEGILSYHLCDRNYECDDCPLDAALRKHYFHPSTNEGVQEPANNFRTPLQLCSDYLYSTKHCWLKIMNSERIRIGIEPTLVSALLVPKAIVLPSLGQKLLKQHAVGWIILEDGTFPLMSPSDGKVTAINTILTNEPQILLQDPLEKGWLYEIEPNSKELDATEFMGAERAQKVFAQKNDSFRESLFNELKIYNESVGVTLADGGVLLQNISDIIGQKKYFKILTKIFG